VTPAQPKVRAQNFNSNLQKARDTFSLPHLTLYLQLFLLLSLKSPEQKSAARLRWRIFAREFLSVLCGGWRRLWPRFWIIGIAVGVGAVLVLVFSQADNEVVEKMRLEKGTARSVSQFVSDHADIMFAIPLSIAIWLLGVAKNRARWRKIGIACILATCVAGLITDVFRGGTGRPRPEADLPDGFYGPHPFNSKYQSFPSGHATTSTATAVVIAAALPVTTVPCVIYAVAVNVSRLQLRKHHPIDVLIGSTIGITCGLCFASTIPRTKFRLRRRKKK